MAVALHVGGIGHEQTRPLGAHELGNTFQIRGNAAHGRGIELEVPGMDHAAHRRFHAQREAFGDGMADREKAEMQIPQPHPSATVHGAQLHHVQQLVFTQLVLHQRQREAGTINAHALQLRHNPRQRADMILVPVREHDADQLFLDGRQGRKMRNHHIHAKMAIIGKHQAAIYHHHAAGGFPQLAVEANFAQPSQWRYRQIGFVHQSSASRTNSATGQTRRACPFVSSGTYCRPCRQKFSGAHLPRQGRFRMAAPTRASARRVCV